MAIQREQIVAAALKLLDEKGIEGLSLRRLAQDLAIQAPSLYWHFANKQAVIEAVANALLADVAREVPADLDWRATCTLISDELRQALKSRRDGARVLAAAYVVADNVLRPGEVMIAALVRAGADIGFAATSAFSVFHYVLGLVTVEQSLGGEEAANHGTAFQIQAQGDFPHVLQARGVLMSGDFDSLFSSGLSLMLDGIALRLSQAS